MSNDGRMSNIQKGNILAPSFLKGAFMKHRKGEVITLAVATVAIVMCVVGLLFRPIVDKVLPMFGNNQKIISTKTVESKPVWIKNPDGTSTLVQTTSTAIDNSAVPVPLTFMQKIWQLGVFGISLVILGCLFPPLGAILLFIYNKAKGKVAEWSIKHEGLTADAKKIVNSVDDGLATMDANIKAAQGMADATTDPTVKASYTAISKALMDMKQDFLGALSKTQDSTTKLLVSQLKND